LINRQGSPSDGLGQLDGGSESSASVTRFLASQRAHDFDTPDDDWQVDEVVLKGDQSGLAAAAWRATGARETATGTQTATESRGIASSSGSVRQRSIHSIGLDRRAASGSGSAAGDVWHFLRWRLFPFVQDFFAPRFESADKEEEFRKMSWYTKKRLSAFFSLVRPDGAYVRVNPEGHCTVPSPQLGSLLGAKSLHYHF
jgi:hypothetical protein